MTRFGHRDWECCAHRSEPKITRRLERAVIETLEHRKLLTAETATSADGFVDSIGINTHFGWNDIYANSALQTLLGQTGIRHIRDNPKTVGTSRLSSLYSNYGIQTDVIVDDPTYSPATETSVLTNTWAEAVEGLNEPDLNTGTRSYEGLQDSTTTNDYAATRRYQEELFQAVQANSTTMNKPVLSPAMGYTMPTGSLAGADYDIEAMHSYAENYLPSYWRVQSQFIPKTNLMAGDGPTSPIWATETGYFTGTASGHISETADAKYLPRTLVDYFNMGVQRTFIYELANQGTDPTNPQYNYGVVRNDLSLTPAYTDLKNMISLLGEGTWNAGTQTWSKPSFTPTALDYTMSTSTPTINHLLLQKSNGEFDLVLWNEVSSWDTTNHVDISNAAQNVTLTFNTPLSGASLYSLSSTTATQTWTNPTQIMIGVPDEVVVLKLTPRTSTAPAAIGYADNFQSDALNAVPSGWTQNTGGDWEVKSGTSPANQWLEDRNLSGNHTITHNLGTVTGSWTTDFDTTWRWGGATNNTGMRSLSTTFDMLDNTGNGYRVKMFQGDSNNTTYDNDLTEIYKVTAGVQGGSPLSTGTGYNRPGWQTAGQSTPAWRHVRVSFDAGSHMLFVYEDPDGNGVFDVVAQATDASYSTFSSIAFATPGLTNTEAPMFDNINTSTPTVTIAATDATAGENPVDPGSFTISRTGSTAAALVVNYTIGGSATNGADYSTLGGSVTIAAGAASATVTVTPTSDTALEGDENVVLNLSEGAAYHVGAQRSGEVKITDYIPDLVVTGITFSNPNPTAGDAVTFTITVKNIGTAAVPAGTAVKVNCFIDNDGGTSPYATANYTSGIAPGQSVNLTTSAGTNAGQWIALAGVHDITAWVDPNPQFWNEPGSVAEKSDRNNECYAVINVATAQTTDDFGADTVGQPPTGWATSASGFAVKNDGGQNFLEFTDNGTQSATKTLAAATTGSWEMDVKTGWRWGGFTTSPYQGFHTLATGYDFVDTSGNGYRVKVYQGDSANTGYDHSLVEIYRIAGNVVGTTVIASGGGFNIAGWQSRSRTAPDLRNLRISFDKGTQRLSVSGDSTGTGAYTPFVSFIDTAAPTSISKISLVAIGVTANCAPEWDDFRFKTLV